MNKHHTTVKKFNKEVNINYISLHGIMIKTKITIKHSY